MSHTCHAEGCSIAVPPRMFMCLPHWRRVPQWLKDAVWRYYIPGQENTKVVSKGYLVVQARARVEVAEKEGVDASGAIRDLLSAWSTLDGAPLVGVEDWDNPEIRRLMDEKIKRQMAMPRGK